VDRQPDALSLSAALQDDDLIELAEDRMTEIGLPPENPARDAQLAREAICLLQEYARRKEDAKPAKGEKRK